MSIYILLAAVLATSSLSAIVGMAGGMVLMGVLAATMPVAAAMIVHGTSQIAANGCRALFLRSHIHWRGVGVYVAVSLLAVAAFRAIAWVPRKDFVLIALGALPLIAIGLKRLTLDFTRRGHAAIAGLVISLLQLTAGVSGPALDLFFLKGNLERRQVIATKALLQTLGHLHCCPVRSIA